MLVQPKPIVITPPSIVVDPPAIDVTPPEFTVDLPALTISPPPVHFAGKTYQPPGVNVKPPPFTIRPPGMRIDPPAIEVNIPPITVQPPALDVQIPTDVTSMLVDPPPFKFDLPPIRVEVPSITLHPPTMTIDVPAFEAPGGEFTVHLPWPLKNVTIRVPGFTVRLPPISITPPPLTIDVPAIDLNPPPVTIDPPSFEVFGQILPKIEVNGSRFTDPYAALAAIRELMDRREKNIRIVLVDAQPAIALLHEALSAEQRRRSHERITTRSVLIAAALSPDLLKALALVILTMAVFVLAVAVAVALIMAVDRGYSPISFAMAMKNELGELSIVLQLGEQMIAKLPDAEKAVSTYTPTKLASEIVHQPSVRTEDILTVRETTNESIREARPERSLTDAQHVVTARGGEAQSALEENARLLFASVQALKQAGFPDDQAFQLTLASSSAHTK